MFFGYSLLTPEVHYAVVSPTGTITTRIEGIETRCGKPVSAACACLLGFKIDVIQVMMHDMAITRNYSILLEFPLCFEMSRATAGQMPYKMDYSQPSRFGVQRCCGDSR